MMTKALSNKLTAIFAACLITTACANDGYKNQPVYESLYSTPLPLASGGEAIDVLVRVTKAKSHYFNVVFVVKRSYSKEQKDSVYRAIHGFANLREFESTSPHPVPYPLKFRFQLDSVDAKTLVHLDEVVTEVPHVYSSFPDKDTAWHARVIGGRYLEPGIYRVRIENLKPCQELDRMEILFQFEAVQRKA
jgi:hypothetical protein